MTPITYPDNFNYAFDVIDELAKTKPNKLAMIWVSKDETEEKRFTFRDLMKLSNKAANYFISLGIKKGDKVLLVLKRSYLFWISMLALHKIGAIGICGNTTSWANIEIAGGTLHGTPAVGNQTYLKINENASWDDIKGRVSGTYTGTRIDGGQPVWTLQTP